MNALAHRAPILSPRGNRVAVIIAINQRHTTSCARA